MFIALLGDQSNDRGAVVLRATCLKKHTVLSIGTEVITKQVVSKTGPAACIKQLHDVIVMNV